MAGNINNIIRTGEQHLMREAIVPSLRRSQNSPQTIWIGGDRESKLIVDSG